MENVERRTENTAVKLWHPLRFCLFVLLPFALFTGWRSLGAAASPAGRMSSLSDAPGRVILRAVPFPLQDVRLLDGLFREAMLRDQKYLLDLDPERLLHDFRVNAGLPSTARPLGGWEAPDVELRGHTVGHYLSALASMYASTGDGRFKTRGDAIVAELAKVQQASPSKGYHEGYLSAFPEELIDRVEARRRVWAPYYTLHKIMAGLLDMYQWCGNRQALDVLKKQAGWVRFRMDRLTRDQQQAMLMTEHGGMTEVLANLEGVTGDIDYLRVARLFDHAFILEPLARREDRLDGLHANTQIPKIIGAAREYELTGDVRYRDIATFFWERVALSRSYANGGHSDDESFFPVEKFSEHLGASSSETCNTYNMLKLTRHLFSWEPSATLMDFYERGLYNHILASQDPATGGMTYYCPFLPGAFRTYSTPDASFWCCVGTGLENHAKYPDSVYFQSGGTLYVNLFIASELNWREKGLRIRQDTRFPEEDGTRLSFSAREPVRLAVKVRFPAWATSGMTLSLNGAAQPVTGKPGSYVTVDREWKTGDTLAVRMPMALRIEALPDNPKAVAVLYGPILLAGDLGKEGLTPAVRYGPSAPPVRRMTVPAVPGLVGDTRTLVSAIKPVAGLPLTFRTSGIGRPTDVTFVPFYRASDIRYAAYWNVYTAAEWETHAAERAAAEARQRSLPARTVDTVDLGIPDSEKAHEYRGPGATQADFDGRMGREAAGGAWFSYVLKARPGAPLALAVTCRGSEGKRRVFDIVVDGEKIATETLPYHPTELLDMEYPIPEALTRGKTRIVVMFQPQDQAATAQVFEIRTLARQ
ncbi:MAG TPA: beta-L-arabinofuranosidase domain-containing protein [Vicinamibacterales bacterium]